MDLCENSWYGIHYSGYHREYDVELQLLDLGGGSGTGYQEDYGTGWSVSGDPVWVMIDAAEGGGTGWDGEEYVACTDRSGAEGLYMAEWDMSILMNGSALMAPYAELSPPRKIFPAEYEVGGAGSWSYNDTANITDASFGSFTADSSGTYTDDGFEDVTIKGTKYTAYKITNTYTVNIDSPLGAQVVNGQQELWYVNGIGLVREVNISTDDGSTIVSRDITSWSGLTPL